MAISNSITVEQFKALPRKSWSARNATEQGKILLALALDSATILAHDGFACPSPQTCTLRAFAQQTAVKRGLHAITRHQADGRVAVAYVEKEHMTIKTVRMLEVEREFEGRPLEELLPALLNSEGSQERAAAAMGVSIHTIKKWVLRLAIRHTGTWTAEKNNVREASHE